MPKEHAQPRKQHAQTSCSHQEPKGPAWGQEPKGPAWSRRPRVSGAFYIILMYFVLGWVDDNVNFSKCAGVRIGEADNPGPGKKG